MVKIAVVLADGFEELEGLTPVDVLRRSGAQVTTVAIENKIVVGAHDIAVMADTTVNEIDLSVYDAIVLPGGMPGATNISNSKKVISAVKSALNNGKLVCAICASPAVVLAGNNLIDGYTATCFPSEQFISALKDKYVDKSVCVCKNLITANGPKSAMEFAFAICNYFNLPPKI